MIRTLLYSDVKEMSRCRAVVLKMGSQHQQRKKHLCADSQPYCRPAESETSVGAQQSVLTSPPDDLMHRRI